jgi:hypothetical protein
MFKMASVNAATHPITPTSKNANSDNVVASFWDIMYIECQAILGVRKYVLSV